MNCGPPAGPSLASPPVPTAPRPSQGLLVGFPQHRFLVPLASSLRCSAGFPRRPDQDPKTRAAPGARASLRVGRGSALRVRPPPATRGQQSPTDAARPAAAAHCSRLAPAAPQHPLSGRLPGRGSCSAPPPRCFRGGVGSGGLERAGSPRCGSHAPSRTAAVLEQVGRRVCAGKGRTDQRPRWHQQGRGASRAGENGKEGVRSNDSLHRGGASCKAPAGQRPRSPSAGKQTVQRDQDQRRGGRSEVGSPEPDPPGPGTSLELSSERPSGGLWLFMKLGRLLQFSASPVESLLLRGKNLTLPIPSTARTLNIS